MRFLAPESLFIFLPIAAIVVFLYLLKLKRKDHIVSSVMFWRQATADIQANAPFQKLKKNLLLILQILALLMLVMAAARPFIKSRGISDNKIVIIIDSSASMKSTDINQSRFEYAKSKAGEIVSKIGPGDSVLLITAGSKAKAVVPFTHDKKLLSNAISSLKPTDTSCDIRQALILAFSLVAGESKKPPRVVVFSDGGFTSADDLVSKNVNIEFIKIGKSDDNIAITNMDSRTSPSGSQQVFIGMRNFGSSVKKFNLEIYYNNQLMDVREENLKPKQSKQEIIEDVPESGGALMAKLDISDNLASDNTAWTFTKKRRKISVLYISKGNVFLETALNLDPSIDLNKSDKMVSDLENANYDIVVFDRVNVPDKLPQGGYLLIDSYGESAPGIKEQTTGTPSIINWPHNNPITAYVDFSGIKISKANFLKPKPWAVSILDGSSGAFAVAGERNGYKFVQVSFDFLNSDFPLRAGFPIFIMNTLSYLSDKNSSDNGQTVRTGQPVYINVPPSISNLKITDPSGGVHSVKVTSNPVVYDGTENVGLYNINAKSYTSEYACNLSSAQESDIAVKSSMSVGGKQIQSAKGSIRTNQELYWALLLICIAVLTFEWYAYHRRI